MDDNRIEKLQEIADGAFGDGPATRGRARDEIARMTSEPLPIDKNSGARKPALVQAPGLASRPGPAGFDQGERLPAALPGHWSTPDGQEMATDYARKERKDLCHGAMTDMELANAVYMVDRFDLELLGYQTAAKERIRWLSAQLALAKQSPAPSPPITDGESHP